MPPIHQSTHDLPDDVVLRVNNVSKKFCRNLRRSMWYGIKDLSRNLVGVGTGDQKSEVGSQKSEVGLQTPDLRPPTSVP